MIIELTQKGIDKILEIARGVEPLDIEHLHYLITFEDLKRELLLKQLEHELHNTNFCTANHTQATHLVDEDGTVIGSKDWKRDRAGWIKHVDN
jgi:fructose-1,6-bisphosphatase